MARSNPGQLSYAQYMELLRLTSDIPAAQQILKNIGAPQNTPVVPPRVSGLTMKKITRAAIEHVLGENLDNTLAYSFGELADIQQGWNRTEYNGYSLGADQETCEKIAQIMKLNLESEPRLYNARVVMQVSMTTGTADSSRLYKWTNSSPKYDRAGRYSIGNLVFLTRDGRLVARNDAWWGITEPCPSISYATKQCAHHMAYLLSAYHVLRSDFILGVEELLKSDKQK